MSAPEAQPDSRQGAFRDLFPGYFPPTADDLATLFTTGLVVFDTNALFDAYRLIGQARREFLNTLPLLGQRLWIPHRVAEEFLQRRLVVLGECAGAAEQVCRELGPTLEKARQQLRAFGNRRGLTRDQLSILLTNIEGAEEKLNILIASVYQFDIAADARPEDDPIFCELEQILRGKVGPAFDEHDAAEAEAEGQRRFAKKIPPGYADAKKEGERKYGDYLLWEQTLVETARRGLPLLLVSNDEKEDWVRRDHHKRRLGPHPDLVKEVRERSGQAFHLVNVQSFLVLAKMHLGANVSDTTVDQAERLVDEVPLALKLSDGELEAVLTGAGVTPEDVDSVLGTMRRYRDQSDGSYVPDSAAKAQLLMDLFSYLQGRYNLPPEILRWRY